jgi:hypothetical protein
MLCYAEIREYSRGKSSIVEDSIGMKTVFRVWSSVDAFSLFTMPKNKDALTSFNFAEGIMDLWNQSVSQSELGNQRENQREGNGYVIYFEYIHFHVFTYV